MPLIDVADAPDKTGGRQPSQRERHRAQPLDGSPVPVDQAPGEGVVPVHSCSLLPVVRVRPVVESGHLGSPQPPVAVLELHQFVVRPVQVVAEEGHLLDQLIDGVATDPPRLSTSSSKLCRQFGQLTDRLRSSTLLTSL